MSDQALRALVVASGADATGRPGGPATDLRHRPDPSRTVEGIASRLAGLHTAAVPEDGGHAVLQPADVVALVVERYDSGRIDHGSLGAAYRHLSVDRLVGVLVDGAPPPVDPSAASLTHGRPGLGNVWCHRGEVLGFVGWEHLALGDPHRDLAWAARSIATELAPAVVPALLVAYEDACAAAGGARFQDPLRLDWYALAAELSA